MVTGTDTGYELHMACREEKRCFVIENRFDQGPQEEGSTEIDDLTFGKYLMAYSTAPRSGSTSCLS